MSHQPEKTVIVFPRIAGRDGPAKTLNKADFFDPRTEGDPFFNPVANGVSSETVPYVANKKTLTTQLPPNLGAQVTRTAQVFRSNNKRPDEATRKLIEARRR